MTLIDTIGLKIVAAKGFTPQDERIKSIELQYLLFDDNETYIEFDEQDYYSFPDCSSSARIINVRKNSETWKNIMENYPDATYDFTF